MDRYAKDKAKVLSNLGPDDSAVIDIDDEGSAAWADVAESMGARTVRVSKERVVPGGATASGGALSFVGVDGALTEIVDVERLQIRGAHNVSNALAAASAAHAFGVRIPVLADALASFRPIEHRLEPVGVAAGAEWFNDSKATNPDAVSKALTAFGDRPLVLLLGGRNKGNSFGPLALEAAERSRGVVLFGEACGELREAFEATSLPVRTARGLEEAVAAAAEMAEPGDAVVLSPACASFDEFKNYEERGAVFRRLVADLAGVNRGD